MCIHNVILAKRWSDWLRISLHPLWMRHSRHSCPLNAPQLPSTSVHHTCMHVIHSFHWTICPTVLSHSLDHVDGRSNTLNDLLALIKFCQQMPCLHGTEVKQMVTAIFVDIVLVHTCTHTFPLSHSHSHTHTHFGFSKLVLFVEKSLVMELKRHV